MSWSTIKSAVDISSIETFSIISTLDADYYILYYAYIIITTIAMKVIYDLLIQTFMMHTLKDKVNFNCQDC